MTGAIVHLFSAVHGGGQNSRVILANAMAERGHAQVCAMLEAKGPFLERLNRRIPLVDIGTRRPALVVARLVRLFKEVTPQAVITSGPACTVPAVLARALSRTRTPIIVHQGTTISGSRRNSAARRTMLYALVRRAYRRADGVIAVSCGVAQDLSRVTGIPESEISIIRSSTLTPEIKWLASHTCPHWWLENKTLPVILAVGNLSKIKDHATLIRAFAKLVVKRPCRLVILGEGEERDRLHQLIHHLGIFEHVDLPGHCPNPFSYMARADLLAHTSTHEGSSNVIIEALACGCPVVATDCPHGPAEILDNGRYGRLVPVGDVEGLAREFARRLDGAEASQIARVKLKERAKEFSLDHMVERYLAMIERKAA